MRRNPNIDGEIRVLALTKYGRRAASSRHRFLDYIPLLAQRGVTVTAAPLLTDAYVENLFAGRKASAAYVAQAFLRRIAQLTLAHRFDVVWIEGELFPRLPALVERVKALLGRPYVVDIDDAIFHTYDRHPRSFVRHFLGRKVDKVFGGATAVMAGNDYLAERARQAGAGRVEVVPTTVDLDAYTPAAHNPEAPPIFCWIGSPATEVYLETISSELDALLRTTPATLRLIGLAPQPKAALPDAIYRPWSEETEAEEIAACDIGLAPLPDGPWERGKCGLKAIQYMAAELPVLAANVGALSSIVVHGETGFLYNDGEEFNAFARRLAGDRELRLRMGTAGRRRVADHYSIERWADTVRDVLVEAAKGGRR